MAVSILSGSMGAFEAPWEIEQKLMSKLMEENVPVLTELGIWTEWTDIGSTALQAALVLRLLQSSPVTNKARHDAIYKVRDILCLRCHRQAWPNDRMSFVAQLRKAFMNTMTDHDLQQMGLAYFKVLGGHPEAFHSKNEATAIRRGCKRGKRLRDGGLPRRLDDIITCLLDDEDDTDDKDDKDEKPKELEGLDANSVWHFLNGEVTCFKKEGFVGKDSAARYLPLPAGRSPKLNPIYEEKERHKPWRVPLPRPPRPLFAHLLSCDAWAMQIICGSD